MNDKITRRQALTVAAGVAATTLLAAQDKKPADKSWVGLTVLAKEPTTMGILTSPLPIFAKGPRPEDAPKEFEHGIELSGLSYAVKAEKGTRIRILSHNGPAWAEKDGFVPLADAVGFFTERAKAAPQNPYPLNARGFAQKLLDKRAEAIKIFDELLKLFPNDPDALTNRALTLAESGDFDRAFKDLQAALELPNPSNYGTTICTLGYAHELKGEFEKAIKMYKLAHDSLSLLGANNLAWVRATCPDAKFRDWVEAVYFAKHACDATENLEGMYLDTLAAAMAEAGKFDDAVKTQELAHKDKSYDLAYGDEGRARLKLYRQKKPFRTEAPKR